MIEVAHLTKRYGAKVAVDDISFVVGPGRVTGFLGPNGAGKSTTLRILLGLDRADAGTALIGGKRYRDLRHPLRTVGALLDGAGPVPERRAVDHLTWIAQSNRIPRGRVREVLEVVGLGDVAKQQVKKYSLGMSRRLGLAAALLGDPEVLVLDEPVNGLDPDGIRWVRTFLRDYAARGRTVLLSSHLMTEMADTADEVVVINQGRIAADGPLGVITAGHASLEAAFFALTGEPPPSPGHSSAWPRSRDAQGSGR
ncbi:ABC transporter ATP-binding protein [Micromonospora cathayae]|uniref:ATP-binding cassette domain-containing protein n=1 Tax=Micromonospora cathayae TaxID=3028804 RepID=A0ABY7ZUC2_9ACTN|nr:ATP-binding cassette domain-containing protein [Micromonospora sp. HUAS 3]WDZ86615.1 ATP-binding cassette domain-containing protein [Micromonospora sp. HUAS 3]